jgi:hypothetical protein
VSNQYLYQINYENNLEMHPLVPSNPGSNTERRKKLRRPGIEPGSTAWKAAMLTIIPPTLAYQNADRIYIQYGISTNCHQGTLYALDPILYQVLVFTLSI